MLRLASSAAFFDAVVPSYSPHGAGTPASDGNAGAGALARGEDDGGTAAAPGGGVCLACCPPQENSVPMRMLAAARIIPSLFSSSHSDVERRLALGTEREEEPNDLTPPTFPTASAPHVAR